MIYQRDSRFSIHSVQIVYDFFLDTELIKVSSLGLKTNTNNNVHVPKMQHNTSKIYIYIFCLLLNNFVSLSLLPFCHIFTFCHFGVLSFWPFDLLSFCPFVLLSFHPFVLLSFFPFVLLSFCPFFLFSFFPFVLLSFSPFVLLSFCIFSFCLFFLLSFVLTFKPKVK